MAVYRSDQAQVTFGTEYGAHGGYTEAATDVNKATSDEARLTEDTPAGTRTLAVDNMSAPPVAGDFVQIGPTVTDSNLYYNAEIRRVEYVDGTTAITLDSPTGFFHPDNTDVSVCESVTEADEDKFITWLPGVYETVDVPDP